MVRIDPWQRERDCEREKRPERRARSRMDDLAARLRAVEERWHQAAFQRAGGEKAHDGAEAVQAAAGVLHRGRLHEWFGVEVSSAEEALADTTQKSADDAAWSFSQSSVSSKQNRAIHTSRRPQRDTLPWSPAIAVLMDAVTRAVEQQNIAARGFVVWVGRAVWPYPVVIPESVLQRSIFVDPRDDSERLWAIDVCARSAAVCAAVADGSRLSLQATRRLQLACETSRALVMLARPVHELAQRSAAAYRWRVRAVPAREDESRKVTSKSMSGAGSVRCPRWEVELVRSKDAGAVTWSGTTFSQQQSTDGASVGIFPGAPSGALPGAFPGALPGAIPGAHRVVVELRHGQGLVALPAAVADRTHQASAGSPVATGAARFIA